MLDTRSAANGRRPIERCGGGAVRSRRFGGGGFYVEEGKPGRSPSDQDKFFGKTVIHAFRVADLAAKDEILVSGHLKSLIADRGLEFRDERDVTLKGFTGTHAIARVEWR